MHTAIDTYAQPLLTAYANRQVFAADPATGPADSATAYAVQGAVWYAIAGDARPTAWKVAAPTRDDTPLTAPIQPQRVVIGSDAPAVFPANALIGLGVEAEIAVCLGHDLPVRATPYTRAEIQSAVASLHVAIELVDTRLADPQAAGPEWRLADSLQNGGLVIGSAIPVATDLSGPTVRITWGGQVQVDAIGKQPLDDLFYCLPWLVSHSGGLHAGDFITTGSWTGMHPVGLPAEVKVEFVGIGTAEVRLR
ncbi:MAG: hydratase [Betaproteobacteria bacterium]|nr:MAG: hydratase [Betaproteobacteria bacterium]